MKKANSGRPIRFRTSSYLTEKRVSLLHTRHFGREGPIDFHKLVVHLPFVLTVKMKGDLQSEGSSRRLCNSQKVRCTDNSSSSKSRRLRKIQFVGRR
jgi:hypothetical protein